MATFSASLTNGTVLTPQSRDSSHHIYHRPTTCRSDPWGRQHRSLVSGSDLAVSYSYYGYLCAIRERNGPQEYWHLHPSDCRNTLIYAHTTSRTLAACDMSLVSLTVVMTEAGDFVESLQPYFGEAGRLSRSRIERND
jgi:hypothetical protein